MRTPPFLHRAMHDERHARKFVDEGVVCLSHIDRYRRTEDPVRQDSDEGTAHYRAPLDGCNGSRPADWVRTTRSIFNPVFLLCMAGPSVEPEVLTRFGPHVIRINDPNALRRDLESYFKSVPGTATACVELRQVSYNPGEPVNLTLDERARHVFTYTQKSPSHAAECEWRIALIIVGDRPRSGQIIARLGKRLEYCDLLPNYSMNPSAGERVIS